ncbi:hypothetical protein vseg_014795 [Gypsophila vaccaria]
MDTTTTSGSSTSTSTTWSALPNQEVDERKRKRMESNRESARRSRLRKQSHVDELTAQVANLAKMNEQIAGDVHVATQEYLRTESQNSVLRVQISELTHRLQSLNEINDVLTCKNNGVVYDDAVFTGGTYQGHFGNYNNSDGFFMVNNNNPPWNCVSNHQPIMASADMFQY